jgi:peptidoglycan hydrolase CwlO-like protein
MFKKLFLIAVGGGLVLALLFGRKLVPYATTAFEKVRATVNEQVPISFELDSARKQLGLINKDVRNMMYEIAKEEVAVEQLESRLASQRSDIERQQANILRLRDHLESGEAQFVVHGRSYGNDRVRDDLRTRFENFKTSEATAEKTQQVLDARRNGLESAKQRLEQMIAQRHELEIQIENLDARHRMIEVAKTSSQMKLDDSNLARTREMIDDIKARLDVDEKLLDISPQYTGEIPMDAAPTIEETDLLEQIDAHFSQDPTVAQK